MGRYIDPNPARWFVKQSELPRPTSDTRDRVLPNFVTKNVSEPHKAPDYRPYEVGRDGCLRKLKCSGVFHDTENEAYKAAMLEVAYRK